jgi:hypothetical protein
LEGRETRKKRIQTLIALDRAAAKQIIMNTYASQNSEVFLGKKKGIES